MSVILFNSGSRVYVSSNTDPDPNYPDIEIGNEWINEETQISFICVAVVDGVSEWKQTSNI